MRNKVTPAKMNAQKRGNKLGFWFFRVCVKLFGVCGAYGLLYLVCAHYLLFDKKAVVSARVYIRRRFPGCGLCKSLGKAYRLFVSQGKQLVDRFAILSGSARFDIELEGYERFSELLAQEHKGFVLLTAHVGNWQIALTALKKMQKPVYLIMRPEDNAAVRESLHIDAQDERIRVISPEGYLGGVVEAMNALKEGSIVSVMGDRKYGFEGTEVSFLKDKAYFPYGAFSIAASSNCPVVVLLSAKLPGRKYVVDVSHVIYPRYEGTKDKRGQLRKYVQEFAGILDTYVEEYPYQCFLFHDVWRAE